MDTAPVTPPPAPPPPQLQPALARARLARPSSEAATEARKRRPGSRTTRASRDTVHTEPGLLGEAEVDRIDIIDISLSDQPGLHHEQAGGDKSCRHPGHHHAGLAGYINLVAVSRYIK